MCCFELSGFQFYVNTFEKEFHKHLNCNMNFESATPETEYAKDPKIKRDDIQALMQWVKDDPNLPDVTGTELN